MRCKPALFLCVLMGLLFLTCQLVLAVDASPAERRGDVLVVYPEEADRRGQADNLSAIAEVLFAMGYRADWLEMETAKGALKDYDKVIWCAAADSERMDPELVNDYDGFLLVLGQAKGLARIGIVPLTGLEGDLIGTTDYRFADGYRFEASVEVMNAGVFRNASYKSGELTILGKAFPLVSGSDRVRYIPLMDYTGNYAKALLTREIADWLWIWDSPGHAYSQFVVLDEVYPFTDPYRLRDFVNYMAGLKMNFVISVMPIYEHGDYPAMKRFCEVLRYAQANGGAVVLHAPVIQSEIDPEVLTEQLTIAAGNYFDNGVWILGLEVPSEWAFDEALTGVLGRSRTLLFSDLEAFAGHSVQAYGLNRYLGLGSRQIVPAFRLDETGVSHTANSPTAVYLKPDVLTDAMVYAGIDAVKDSPVPMGDLWGMDQSLYLNDSKSLLWDGNTLMVDGMQRFRGYEPLEAEEIYDYKRNIYYRFVTNLARQNRFLIAVSGVVLVVFIFLVIQSRRQMRKRFLKSIPNETRENIS